MLAQKGVRRTSIGHLRRRHTRANRRSRLKCLPIYSDRDLGAGTTEGLTYRLLESPNSVHDIRFRSSVVTPAVELAVPCAGAQAFAFGALGLLLRAANAVEVPRYMPRAIPGSAKEVEFG